MKYYHGANRNNSYFEGWYLKYQTKDGKALALIPALHIDATERRSISLQILTDSASWWLEYPETEFQASQRRFHVRVGKIPFAMRKHSCMWNATDFLSTERCITDFLSPLPRISWDRSASLQEWSVPIALSAWGIYCMEP